jgi:hypothetical protein
LLTASYIGRAIEDEYLWHCWKEVDAKQARLIRAKVNERTNARVRHKAQSGFARRLQAESVAAKAWSDHRRFQVGIRFVDYLSGIRTTVTDLAS